MNTIQRAGQAIFLRVEAVFDAFFGQALNPFHHLGVISFYLFWLVSASGLYLYAFFDTGVAAAYGSVESITHNQWYVGGILRSIHRYASDGMVITMVLHLLRQYAFDRYSGFRTFSWITGVPLVWMLYASGIGGYWLVWDELAQFAAIGAAEWLDWLPIFNNTLIRNFLYEGAVNDRFFTLIVFMHIGIPLIMLAFMWVHVQRITGASTVPPRPLAAGIMIALVALSLIKPAVSHGPANLDIVPQMLEIDWYYLGVFPLMYAWSPGTIWWLSIALTVFLTVLPWLPPKKRQPVALVDPDNCNGCGHCQEDCPYSAVTMMARPDKPGHKIAVVVADNCASCGICAGSCPASTPFRSAADLVTGIDMPALPVHAMRAQAQAELERLAHDSTRPRIVVYGCDCAAPVRELAGPGVSVFSLPCTGQLPPSFIDYILRDRRADGVFITGCCEGDCAYRYGNIWTEQRLKGEREPHLRTRVPRERVRVKWAASNELTSLQKELADFRAHLQSLPAPESADAGARVSNRRTSNA